RIHAPFDSSAQQMIIDDVVSYGDCRDNFTTRRRKIILGEELLGRYRVHRGGFGLIGAGGQHEQRSAAGGKAAPKWDEPNAELANGHGGPYSFRDGTVEILRRLQCVSF